MNDDQVLCENLVATGKLSLDNGAITSDGSGGVFSNGTFTTGGISTQFIAGGQSSTSPAIVNGGTITQNNLRVTRVSPASAVTGIILAASTSSGKELTVVNEAIAANSITFDVAGTSHVADGVSTVIPGLTAARFVWDSGTSLWYHCK